MLILDAQDNFHIILSYCVEGHLKKSLNFMSSIDFQASKIWMLFVKNRCFLKPFSGRNNSLELPGFGISNSLLYVLEESIELRTLISWVLGE